MNNQNDISVAEAAEILTWPYHRVIRRAKRRKFLKARKVGWGWILDRTEVEELKAANAARK